MTVDIIAKLAPKNSAFRGLIDDLQVIPSFASTATAAGTTTLTVASARIQEFTGSTTQTIVLPVVSTLQLGQEFIILNNSTGAVTINSSGGNAVQVVAAGQSAIVRCILVTGTSAASWSCVYSGGISAQAANSILANPTTSSAVPTAVTVAEQTLVGRITGGNVDDLSATQVRTLLNVEDGAEVNNISDANATDLTDGGVTTLHKHAANTWDIFSFCARLSLETMVPFSVTEQSAKTMLYLTAYGGDRIGIFSGTAWESKTLVADISVKTTDAQTGTTTSGNKVITGLTDTTQLVVGMLATGTGIGAAPNAIASIDSATQVTLSVNSTASASVTVTFKLPASTVYDVFVYWSTNTLKLELVAGTATRALQNGIDVKTGDATKRLAGTICTTATAGQLDWTKAEKSVCNLYNPLLAPFSICPGYNDNSLTTTINVTSTSWVEANNGTGSRIKFVLCKPKVAIATWCVLANPGSGDFFQIGIGWDAVVSKDQKWSAPGTNFANVSLTDNNKGLPLAAGSHYLSALVSTYGGGTTIYHADLGAFRKGSATDPEGSVLSAQVEM